MMVRVVLSRYEVSWVRVLLGTSYRSIWSYTQRGNHGAIRPVYGVTTSGPVSGQLTFVAS